MAKVELTEIELDFVNTFETVKSRLEEYFTTWETIKDKLSLLKHEETVDKAKSFTESLTKYRAETMALLERECAYLLNGETTEEKIPDETLQHYLVDLKEARRKLIAYQVNWLLAMKLYIDQPQFEFRPFYFFELTMDKFLRVPTVEDDVALAYNRLQESILEYGFTWKMIEDRVDGDEHPQLLANHRRVHEIKVFVSKFRKVYRYKDGNFIKVSENGGTLANFKPDMVKMEEEMRTIIYPFLQSKWSEIYLKEDEHCYEQPSTSSDAQVEKFIHLALDYPDGKLDVYGGVKKVDGERTPMDGSSGNSSESEEDDPMCGTSKEPLAKAAQTVLA